MHLYYDDLRPYQQEDVDNILQLKRVGVFNQQRTGKTPTTIVASAKLCNKILVIAPASMLAVWAYEIERWSGLPAYVYSSALTKRKRDEQIVKWNNKRSYLIMSYDMYRSEKNQSELRRTILSCKPDGLIVDEAHRAVGRKTKAFNALKQSKHIKHMFLLSGTPAPNHPSQVWSLLYLLDHKRFSSYWRFVEEYFAIEDVRLPRHMQQRTGLSHIQQPSGFLPDKEPKFAGILDSYSIMRKRKDVMKWLPPQEEIEVVPLEPTASQTRALANLEKYFKAGSMRVEGVLDQLTRMRQVCTVPSVLDIKGKNPKTEWIKSYIADYPDKSIIIFSRFTTYILELSKELDTTCGVFVGGMKSDVKRDLINNFQSGKINVLLIQIDAGKEGLTLDKASTLIFSDIFPPVSDIDQAKDRIIATSEENVKPYSIIGLCIKDTYDQEMYEMYRDGKALTDVANNYIQYVRRK